MKTWLLAISMVLAGGVLGAASMDAQAKRLGGGKPAGMQRQAPAKPADGTPASPTPGATNPATNPAATGAAAAPVAAAAQAGKRSWLGPIAGIAAGLGLAALFSHLGWGEGFANIVTLLLLAAVAFVAVRWLMRRFAGGSAAGGSMKLAGAGAPASGLGRREPELPTMARSTLTEPPVKPVKPMAITGVAPEGFDAQSFERVAKMIFVRLQAANDAGLVDDLRKFTTPELFASLKLDVAERAGAAQQTDVVQLDAKVVDSARERDQWIVSVRFSGLIREGSGAGAEPFAELWHLVKPVQGDGDWAIAGIAPVMAAAA